MDLALALVAEDEAKHLRIKNSPDIENSIPKKYRKYTIPQYVDEVLKFLEEINWERDSFNDERQRDPFHPFSPVFDAIELVLLNLLPLLAIDSHHKKQTF